MGRWGEEEEPGTEENGNNVDDKERERLEIQREKRREEREAAQAQIAPTLKNPVQKRHNFQKKTEQVFQVSDVGDKKKNAQLRYEESIPWHLEDFDNKNIWSSSFEAALSECHVLMLPTEGAGSKSFRMIPVEKWYKFTPKNLFKALSIDEAEARMGKRVKDLRWFMETQKTNETKEQAMAAYKNATKMFTRKAERGERRIKDEGDGDEEKPEVVADADDIDYNYDEAFADDEENPLFGGDDEENKEAEDKIKREQRDANIFELKEQKDFDKEEEEAKRKAEEEKKLAKKVAKALMKREKNYAYEDESEGNPYSSSVGGSCLLWLYAQMTDVLSRANPRTVRLRGKRKRHGPRKKSERGKRRRRSSKTGRRKRQR